MSQINDYEHNIAHMYDVVTYTKELFSKISIDVNIDVCIICAYWHDVERIKINQGHEKLSAEMLKSEMKKLEYNNDFINMCYMAIINHKWNMHPKTIEGLIVKDADKLGWIGIKRWSECIKHNKKLDAIINLLPNLRNYILHFDESREIYDRDILKLIKLLCDNYHNNIKV